MLLELAAFNLDSCRIATNVGVDRLELCENYTNGGITPTLDYFKEARRLFPADIFVMIRPREGNYVFSDEEFEEMLISLEQFKKAGANGFVSGFFTDNEIINISQLLRFVEICYPLPVTFHRSFDLLIDWKSGLDQLIECGCKRLLTSGDGKTAFEGRSRLKEMKEYVKERLIILPGGGIRSSNLQEIINTCHPREVHSAALAADASITGNYTADKNELEELRKILSF